MQKGGSKGRILKGGVFDPKQLGGERKVCVGGGEVFFLLKTGCTSSTLRAHVCLWTESGGQSVLLKIYSRRGPHWHLVRQEKRI